MSRFDVSDDADELNASIDTTNFPRSNSITSNGSWNGSAHESGSFKFRGVNSPKNTYDEAEEEVVTATGSNTQNGFMRRPHPTPLKMRSISESNGNRSDMPPLSATSLKTPRTATTPGKYWPNCFFYKYCKGHGGVSN